MDQSDSKYTAQNMISVHGLRAQAVVQEREAEARQQGDAAAQVRWRSVEAAIAELRRSAGKSGFHA